MKCADESWIYHGWCHGWLSMDGNVVINNVLKLPLSWMNLHEQACVINLVLYIKICDISMIHPWNFMFLNLHRQSQLAKSCKILRLKFSNFSYYAFQCKDDAWKYVSLSAGIIVLKMKGGNICSRLGSAVLSKSLLFFLLRWIASTLTLSNWSDLGIFR